MARERLPSLRPPLGIRRSTLGGRPWAVLCCYLLAFLMNRNGSGGGHNGGNMEPGYVRHWSGGADAADVTADLAQSPDENNLGRLAQACSSYCHAGGVDGLDLWMSFKEVCVPSSSPSFLEEMALRKKGMASSSPSPSTSSSPRQSSSLSPRYYSTGDSAAAAATTAAAVDSGIYSATTQAAWSVLHSIFLCSVVSTFGLFAGFRMGSRLVSVPKAALLPLL